MDAKDTTNKNIRKKRYAKGDMKQYVTKDQLDEILDRNIEDKFLDVVENNIIVGTRDSAEQKIFELTVIPEGEGGSSRIGIRVKPKSLALRILYNGRNTPANNNITTVLRAIVFQWNLDQADQPVVDDILLVLAGNKVQTQPYYRLENVNKFRVIWDKIVHLGNESNSSAYLDQDSLFKQFGKTTRHQLFLEGGDPTTGQYYLLLISDKGNGADMPQVSFNSRFRYEDA